MKKYRKVDNCGPVPYPDQSGKMLTDEVVSGDEWAPLVDLGFVVEVDGKHLPPAEVVESKEVQDIAKPKNKGGRPKKVELKPESKPEPKPDQKMSVLAMALKAAEELPGTPSKMILDSAILAERFGGTKSANLTREVTDGKADERERATPVDTAETGVPGPEGTSE